MTEFDDWLQGIIPLEDEEPEEEEDYEQDYEYEEDYAERMMEMERDARWED